MTRQPDVCNELLEQLRRLEEVAEVARAFVDIFWKTSGDRPRLTFQALTEGMADVPAERDKRCAELRVKAKRALREESGLAPREENDGDL